MAVHTIDWYRTPLGVRQLQELNERSDRLGWFQSAGYLLCMVATAALAMAAWHTLSWPWIVAAVYLHGVIGAFTINGVHELVHGTVFKTKWLNEFFGAIFAFLGWHNHLLFWTSHTEHHKFTLHPPDDLEVVLPQVHSLKSFFKYAFVNPMAIRWSIKYHWRIAHGRFEGAWEKTITSGLAEHERRRIINWSRTVLAGHLAVAMLALATGQWLLIVLVSLLPCYGTWLFYLCNNTQHTGLVDRVPDFRLCCRTILLNPVLQFLYWHMNYHIEHHMYAGVPCYRLKRLHQLIGHELPPCPKGLLETWVQIGHIFSRQRIDKTYQYVQPLPGAAGSDGAVPVQKSKADDATAGKADAPIRNSRGEPPRLWECTVCGFLYDEAAGLPDQGIGPGTAFADLPDDWTCPDCGVAKSDFERVEGAAPSMPPAAAADVLPRDAHPPREDLVIVGSGMAGYHVAKGVRALGVARPITVLTRDGGESYAKPMLSNAFAQKLTPEKLAQNTPAEMAERLNMDVRSGVLVERIDTGRRVVMTDAGEFPYGQLVLAVGADQVTLPLNGSGASRVHQVNDLASYTAFRAALTDGARVVIIGGGLIGCEFANDLAGAGYVVHVVELATHPLARLAPEPIGAALADALREQGVKWSFGTSVETVDAAEGGGLTCRLSGDRTLEANVVLSAVGLRPRINLAQQAGLRVNRGIVVDGHLRTSDAGVYALGDCAEVDGKVMPYVMPLMEGARTLAHTLGGDPRPVSYPVMPVVVKTPALPLVVCPPDAAARGEWTTEGEGRDLTARFVEAASKRLLGFAVSGKAIRQRAELAAAMAGK